MSWGESEVNPDLSRIRFMPSAWILPTARKQVVIAYAGAIAQRLLHPDQPYQQIHQCAEGDRRKIKNIVRECRFVGAELVACKRQAISLVWQLRGVIKKIASALLERQTLTFKEAEKIYRTRQK
jgi:hypothetical protein